jgi:SPP1 gp7 family putative phage head morphogenesis protein
LVYSGHTTDAENDDFFSKLLPLLSGWFKSIWNAKGKVSNLPNYDIFSTVFRHLNKAVENNFITKYKTDKKVIQSLKKNIHVFSIFKTHHQQKEIASLLTKGNKFRSYEEFEKEALQISLNYNKNWLKAEFNTAVEQSKLVSYWQKIKREEKDYPYLQYITRDDDRVRDEHRIWHNTILPVNHPWWSTHFPVNGFNCRCSVKQLTKAQAEAIGITQKPNEESYGKEFSFNAGLTEEIFGEYHSYFQDLPDETVELLREYSENTGMTKKRW